MRQKLFEIFMLIVWVSTIVFILFIMAGFKYSQSKLEYKVDTLYKAFEVYEN